MAFAINFYSDDKLINTALTSGLGFFSSVGFGYSVLVNEFQGSSYITSSDGSIQSYQVNNIKYISANSGNVNNGGSNTNLSGIPNYLSSLNIRYTNDSAVKIQNTKVYCHQRNSGISVAPEGISVYGAEIIHPYPVIEATAPFGGSGDGAWRLLQGTGTILNLVNSPGPTGFYARAALASNPTASTRHDHFLAISVSPTSTGQKLQTLTVEVEYL